MTKLELGNINIHRDWGWAPEYAEAMWAINQHSHGDDFVVATGRTEDIVHALVDDQLYKQG